MFGFVGGCLGMFVVCPGMPVYARNNPSSKGVWCAKKQILAGMSEVFLGMFVVCPGILAYARLYPYP